MQPTSSMWSSMVLAPPRSARDPSCPASPARSRTPSSSHCSRTCACTSAVSRRGRQSPSPYTRAGGARMIDLTVNGQTHSIDADPQTPLLYVLRDDLQLNAAKFGCGLGQCGACTVLIDGAAALACVTPILLLSGRQITTLEGLGTLSNPAPIQQAFIEEQAAQCGFCIAGMMMRAQALLQSNPQVSEIGRAH